MFNANRHTGIQVGGEWGTAGFHRDKRGRERLIVEVKPRMPERVFVLRSDSRQNVNGLHFCWGQCNGDDIQAAVDPRVTASGQVNTTGRWRCH